MSRKDCNLAIGRITLIFMLFQPCLTTKCSLHLIAKTGCPLLTRWGLAITRTIGLEDPRAILHSVVQRDDVKVLQVLINAGISCNTGNLLLSASRYGSVRIIQFLVDNGVDNNVRDKEGRSPLHLAAGHNQCEAVQQLLQCGAVVDATDEHGETPLCHAVQHARPEIVEKLLQADADVRVHDRYKLTLLHKAASRNDCRRIVALLLNAGVSIVAVKTYNGKTPLHLAATHDHADVVTWLLEAGADVNAQDRYGYIPLHIAAKAGNTTIMWLLIKAGASVNQQNCFGETALHFASEKNHVEAVRLLCQNGAMLELRKGEPGGRGWTALNIAIRNGNIPILTLLLAAGANSNVVDGDGNTPLHQATDRWRYPHVDMVRLLLKYKAEPNITNLEGYSPLHNIADANFPVLSHKIARLLLSHGANPELKSPEGKPLSIAIRNVGGSGVGEALIRAEAQIPHDKIFRGLCCHTNWFLRYKSSYASQTRREARFIEDILLAKYKGTACQLPACLVSLIREYTFTVKPIPREKHSMNQAAAR